MEILDFSKGQVWGIVPEKFESIARKFFDYQLKIDPEQFEAFIKTGRGGEEKPYRITDGGSAIIPITGPLTKRASFFSFLFGGTSYMAISNMFKMAMADEDVSSIILDIDSPGGVVSGTEAVGDLIFNARGEKPIVSYANGTMASAAYWIGSAADAIVAQKTSPVGSIGVLMIHTDYSKMNEKEGIKVTYISSGKYKALGNPDEPLKQDAKEYFQAEVDYIYSIFVDTVSRNRDVETDKVLTDMADGQIFIGQQAKDVGLVDNIGDFESALQLAESMINNDNFFIKESIMSGEKNPKIETIDALTAAFPELVQQIQDRSVEAAKPKTESNARKAEQDRILSLIEIQFDEEQSTKLKSVIESGVSAEQFKAITDLSGKSKSGSDGESDEEKAAREKALKALENSGADNPGAGDDGVGKKDYMTLVEEYMTTHNVPRLKAMQAINRSHPKEREQYIKDQNPHLRKAQ